MAKGEPCSVEGCERPQHAKLRCQSHYKTMRNHQIKEQHRFKDRPEFEEAERLVALGLTASEVARLVGTDKWTILRNFDMSDRRGKGRYNELLPLVQQGMSLNEIRRTIGMDYRTVRRYFPYYRPFEVGGGGRAADLRKANEILNGLELK